MVFLLRNQLIALWGFLSLSLSFANFIIICLGVGLFGFSLFGALCTSCILILVSFRSGMFSAIISSNIFSTPFSFSSFGIPIMHRLACFILYYMSLILLSFFFNLFFVCCPDWVVCIILFSKSLIHFSPFNASISAWVSANEFSNFSWLILIAPSSFLK